MKKLFFLFMFIMPFMFSLAMSITLDVDIIMEDVVYQPNELVEALIKINNLKDEKVYFMDYWVDEHYYLNARVLRKGHNEVKLFFNAPSTPGFHTLKIKIYDGKYYSITKEKEFVVSQEAKGFLIELKPKVSITSNKANLLLKIANMGTYDDLFEILLPKYSTKSNYSYVEVGAGDIGYVGIEADFSDYISNNYNFPVKVCSLHLWSCLETNAEILVKREESKETSLKISSEEFYTYPDSKIFVEIFLNNTSAFDKNYYVSLEPLNFSGKYTEPRLSLPGGESGRMRFYIMPNSTGAYHLKYTVFSNGVSIKEGYFNITVAENPLTIAAIFSPKLGWIYALIGISLIIMLSYIFVKYRDGKFKYPYIK